MSWHSGEVHEEANTIPVDKKSSQGGLRNCGMLNVMSVLGEMMEKILREPKSQETRR